MNLHKVDKKLLVILNSEFWFSKSQKVFSQTSLSSTVRLTLLIGVDVCRSLQKLTGIYRNPKEFIGV
jgi:hypothetical protein